MFTLRVSSMSIQKWTLVMVPVRLESLIPNWPVASAITGRQHACLDWDSAATQAWHLVTSNSGSRSSSRFVPCPCSIAWLVLQEPVTIGLHASATRPVCLASHLSSRRHLPTHPSVSLTHQPLPSALALLTVTVSARPPARSRLSPTASDCMPRDLPQCLASRASL